MAFHRKRSRERVRLAVDGDIDPTAPSARGHDGEWSLDDSVSDGNMGTGGIGGDRLYARFLLDVHPARETGRAKSGHETNRIENGFVEVVDGAHSVRPDHRNQGAEFVASKNRRRNTCCSLKSRAPGERFKLSLGEGDLDRAHLAKFDAQGAVGFER